MENPDVVLVYTTLGNEREARELARILLEKKLAACVNIIPGITGIYEWEGSVQEDPECLMLIKTTPRNLCELQKTFEESHPYDVPEFVATKTDFVSKAYADWVLSSTK